MPNNTEDSEFILVEQAMGNPPSWIVYWGITIVALFFAVVLGISALIRYPDVLQAEATTYIDRPPVEVFAPRTATVHRLLVEEEDSVHYNTPLLVLESTADWEAVLYLDSLFQDKTVSIITNDLLSKELGELSLLYKELALLDVQIRDANLSDITSKRVTSIRKEIEQNKALNGSLVQQKKVFEKELHNIQTDLNRSKKLYQDGVMSQQEFEQKENIYLQNKRALHQMESAIISNKMQVQQLQLQIPESQKQQHDLFFNLETEFQQKKELLRTALEQWKEQYILSSKTSGSVVLSSSLQEGNQVTNTKPFLTILPFIEQKTSFLKAKMDVNGMGKLVIGQKATVFFNNYPSSEYGTLTATVSKIAPIPTENQYEVLLTLPDDWLTNYGISIPKQQKMKVNIAVQTKEYTLLSRVFSGLLDVIKN